MKTLHEQIIDAYEDLILKLTDTLIILKTCVSAKKVTNEGENKLFLLTKKTEKICSKISSLKAQAEQDVTWNNDKVIDFVNWYLRLCGIITDSNCRFELENQTIIDSFLKGDDYKLWWNKYGTGDKVKQEKVTDEKKSGIYYCSVCHNNPVDAENGYDTCPNCISKI